MKSLKKIVTAGIVASTLVLFCGAFVPVQKAEAALDLPSETTDVTVKDVQDLSVEQSINTLTDWLFAALIIVSVLFLLYAGYSFVTAGGDPDKVNTARQMVMYAMIGVGVAVLAKGLVTLVEAILETQGG